MKHTNCMDTLPVTEEVLLAQAQAAVKTLFLARMKEFLKLDRKGIPIYDPAYPAFDGEGMGFRIPLAQLSAYLMVSRPTRGVVSRNLIRCDPLLSVRAGLKK